MTAYYATPESWDQQSNQYVTDLEGIERTVENTDWYKTVEEAIAYCEYLGEFGSQEEAEAEFSK